MTDPLIAPDVTIGESVTFGVGVVIEHGVVLGDGVELGHHVTVHAGTVLGDGVSVGACSVVGRPPRLAASSTAPRGDLEPLRVGAGCSIGSHVVVMAGSVVGERCVVGDGAGVRERCLLGDAVVVGRNATVENDTTIGARTVIQTGAYITAYVTIEEDVFIAPMVVTTNDNLMGRTARARELMRGCTIRRAARIGGGAHILPGVEIGEEAFVATAAVVTRDVAPRSVVMGSPARPVRMVPADELLGID